MEIYKVCLEKRDDDGDVLTSDVVFESKNREETVQKAKEFRDENDYYFVTIETWDEENENLLETTLENQY